MHERDSNPLANIKSNYLANLPREFQEGAGIRSL
jgi:hypothetical protein